MNKIQNLFKLTIVLTFIIGLSGIANAQKSLDKQVLVNIGEEVVKVDEFMRVYNKNNTQTSMQGATPLEEYLDLFINFKLKVMEAEELKMDTISSFNKELAQYRKQLAKPYFIDESVNEAILEEAYQHKLKDIRASHILIMVDENARPQDTLAAFNKIVEIREEVLQGMDFSEAAVTYSEDPSAQDREAIPGQQRAMKGNKGDLGYFTVFNMVYPFEEAAYNTAVGEVSQPVRTRFGYHLIKVTDNKDALGVAQVAHIFVAVPPNTSTEDSIKKIEKINNIYAKVQAGMSFENAVNEYSEDKGSAKNGGKLSKFTCNRVVPEFVLAAEALEIDEVSAPVTTRYGYHIIKLISRDTPGTFEEESPALKEKLAKDARSHKSETAVIEQIKTENNLKIYDKAKVALFASIDTAIINKTFLAENVKSFIKPIMKIGNEKYTQYDFAIYAENNQRKQTNIDKDVYLEQLFGKFVDENCLAFEDKHLEEKYPEFAALMQEYHDGILLFNLTDEKVWSKAVKDTVGLDKFFSEHRDDYMWTERVDATLFKVKKKEDANTLRMLISEHLEDGDIAKALDADSITSITILPGKYERGDNKYLDEVKWKSGTTTEIISDVEDLTTIIRIKEVLPPQPKELNETRGLVTADYQTYLEQEWIRQLKLKYPVVVDKDVLNLVLATQ
jgi:peptidyl-prolyl cis-trans isomerase SurA